jgi:hypothetical protein
VKKIALCAGIAALAFACKKGPTTATLDAGSTAAVATPPPATGTAPATPPPATAAGGEVGSLPAVNDCPKSLGGNEEVARTIKKECGPITVTSSYYVDGSLTLEAGAQLKFQDGAELAVGYSKPAKLMVKGTAEDPVILTAAGDAVPGSWKGVRLYAKADRSQLVGLVIEHAGDDRGALFIGAEDVVVKGGAVRSAKEIGLFIDNQGSVSELSGVTFEKTGGPALSVTAGTVGGLGAGNTFEAGAFIEVRGGEVQKSTKWQNPGAPLQVTQDLYVQGKNNVRAVLEIQPGVELRFGDGVEMAVGYASAGSVTAVGTAEQPVTFTSSSEKAPGAWPGLMVYRQGEGKFENVVFEAGGDDENRAALWVQAEAALTVKGATFKGNRTGLSAERGARLKGVSASSFEGSEKKAMSIAPNELGMVAADNKFGENERIEILGGEVETSQTWNALPAVLEVQQDVQVSKRSTLTLAPGLELRFRDGAELGVGYTDESSLKAVGTAEAPIKLRGAREESGAWTGVVVYSMARDVVLEHVMVAHTGGDAGVNVRGDATVKATDVSCEKCAGGVLKWECPSKVTAAEIKAGEGTPAAEIKPEGC